MITVGDLRNNKDISDDTPISALGCMGYEEILVRVTKDGDDYVLIEESHNKFAEAFDIDLDDAINGEDPFDGYEVLVGKSFSEYWFGEPDFSFIDKD